MKKIMVTAAMALMLTAAQGAFAGINVNVGISLPPLLSIQTPPAVVAVPEAPDVYVVPDIQTDLYFWNGWWWRQWNGRWFRSNNYNDGWAAYGHSPEFYQKVDRGWRSNYNRGQWKGEEWNHQAIPYNDLNQNWKTWKQNRYWNDHPQWGNGNNGNNGNKMRGNGKNYKHGKGRWQNQQSQYQQNPQGQYQQNQYQQGQQGQYQQNNYAPQGNYPRQKGNQQNNGDQDPAKMLFN